MTVPLSSSLDLELVHLKADLEKETNRATVPKRARQTGLLSLGPITGGSALPPLRLNIHQE
jgi:hypothetical protein